MSKSPLSRRDVLRNIALATVSGTFIPAMGQHVHQMAAEDAAATGTYTPKLLNDHEYRTLQRLADLIIPDEPGSPGALHARAADWIDLMCSVNEKLADIYTGGIAWLDRAIRQRDQVDFVSASPAQQTAMLDLIAYRKNETPELGPGIRFFSWARRMVVDAYYTHPEGVKAVGYMGNKAQSQFFVPAESLDYVLKRSPV
ncbi:MAG TPA: gluconate 2-dehydrogenase subunit 3 family protein [Bryobacteraceae bacterium]|nr:gluconate 2-dehydrogenase subunit 3 family protein [Bryobacteraceae bacterium]